MAVNAPDADLTLQSIDTIQFKIHLKNLQAHSGAFAKGNQFPAIEGVVYLTEPASVLELLLQYTLVQSAPDLSTVDFKDLVGLEKAGHKYEMYFVIRETKRAMQCVFSVLGLSCSC